MCGIIGVLPFRDSGLDDVRALQALRHRGPDGQGTWLESSGGAWLGHTRLAVLDLSETGAQPMRDEATGHVIVFNGEIYNHLELRKELLAQGVSCHGHSDTETLLRGYGVWGVSVFSRLRGMFSLAIYDARSREIILCRDRFGIKPLYTGRTASGAFVFASEVRALLPLIEAKISPQGVAAYLQRGCCPHEELLFTGLTEFPAGCWGVIKASTNKIRVVRYWPTGTSDDDANEVQENTDASGEVRRLLEDAVSSHLIADVPVACFLSGGIDSSVITALAARHMGTKKLSTFSVGFSEAAFDESSYAARIAKLYNTDHHHILLKENEQLAFVRRAVEAMDLPSVDAINTYIVSDYVSRNGFKVALSGLGADEIFGGYPVFQRQKIIRLLARVPRWAGNFVRVPGKVRHLLADIPLDKDGEMLALWCRRVWPGYKLRSLGFAVPPFVREPAPVLRDTMAELSWGEMSHYMRDMLLRDSDAMSMAHSLELRVPFLDFPLVSRVLSYASDVKYNPQRPKDLLLRAVQDLLPKQIWDRPKRGFSLPMQQWMLGPLRDYCQSGLEMVVAESLIEKTSAERYWKEFTQARLRWVELWALVVLGHYLGGAEGRKG